MKWYKIGQRRFNLDHLASYHWRILGVHSEVYYKDWERWKKSGYNCMVVLCFVGDDRMCIACRTIEKAEEIIEKLDNRINAIGLGIDEITWSTS